MNDDDDDDATGAEEIDASPTVNSHGIFASFKLDGKRFNGGRLPIDALVELQRYRELILEAAKQAWRESNPDKDMPDDFTSQFDLAVTDIENGSAIPKMEVAPSVYEEFYDIGRSDVNAMFADIVNRNFGIDFEDLDDDGEDETSDESDESSKLEDEPEVGDGSSVGEVLADEDADAESAYQTDEHPRTRSRLLSHLAVLDAFRDFGSSLRGEDSLILSGADSGEEVRITAETAPRVFRPICEQMVLDLEMHDERALARRKYVSTVAGRLVALNADAKNFKINTLFYGQVHGRYKDREKLDDLKAVLESNAQAQLVRVTGRMSWEGDTLLRILNVDAIEQLEIDAEPWSRRIVELASLGRDWHPELDKSPLISFAAIDAAREVLRALKECEIQPGIYPGQDGGVTVEWGSPERVVTLEISPDPEFYLFHLEVASGEAVELDTGDLSEVIERVGEALRD